MVFGDVCVQGAAGSNSSPYPLLFPVLRATLCPHPTLLRRCPNLIQTLHRSPRRRRPKPSHRQRQRWNRPPPLFRRMVRRRPPKGSTKASRSRLNSSRKRRFAGTSCCAGGSCSWPFYWPAQESAKRPCWCTSRPGSIWPHTGSGAAAGSRRVFVYSRRSALGQPDLGIRSPGRWNSRRGGLCRAVALQGPDCGSRLLDACPGQPSRNIHLVGLDLRSRRAPGMPYAIFSRPGYDYDPGNGAGAFAHPPVARIAIVDEVVAVRPAHAGVVQSRRARLAGAGGPPVVCRGRQPGGDVQVARRQLFCPRRGEELWIVAGASVAATLVHPFGWKSLAAPWLTYAVEYPAFRRLHRRDVPGFADLHPGAWQLAQLFFHADDGRCLLDATRSGGDRRPGAVLVATAATTIDHESRAGSTGDTQLSIWVFLARGGVSLSARVSGRGHRVLRAGDAQRTGMVRESVPANVFDRATGSAVFAGRAGSDSADCCRNCILRRYGKVAGCGDDVGADRIRSRSQPRNAARRSAESTDRRRQF